MSEAPDGRHPEESGPARRGSAAGAVTPQVGFLDDSEANTESLELELDETTRSSENGDRIAYELGRLSFIEADSDDSADIEFEDSASQFHREVERINESLPDPKVEAGPELLRSLEAIPQKMAFKIGEAAEMVGVKQYVLRYWESEFDSLRPKKSRNNQRIYSRRDVETALMIKKLLYDDRFSIEGARSALKQLKAQVKEEKGMKAIALSQESTLSSVETKLRGLLTDIRRIRETLA